MAVVLWPQDVVCVPWRRPEKEGLWICWEWLRFVLHPLQLTDTTVASSDIRGGKDVLFSNDGARCWNDESRLHYEGGIGDSRLELYAQWIIRTRQLHFVWQNRHPDLEWVSIQRDLRRELERGLPWRRLITKAISPKESFWRDLSQPLEVHYDLPWHFAYSFTRALKPITLGSIARWDTTSSCWLRDWFRLDD